MNHNFSDMFSVIIDWFLCQYWLHWQLWSETWQLSGWSHFCKDVCVCGCVCVWVCVPSGCLLGFSAWCLSPSKWSFHQGNTVCFVRPAECLVFTLWRAVTSHAPSVKSQRGALSISGIQKWYIFANYTKKKNRIKYYARALWRCWILKNNFIFYCTF